MVFAAPVNSDLRNESVWEVSKQDLRDGNALCYGNLFQLFQKDRSNLGDCLQISDSAKSPATNHSQGDILTF
ncbi:9086_t:CDS:2 [Funneliformis mosseae]|uniref:9086_t:CDS:1 n=1 Tax=Funneliformis mosseae TaxID=27381 RepID=A0A9N9CPK5_FUNMO|nr:9086_t:CDS:2 [Funneliformis mosseae]